MTFKDLCVGCMEKTSSMWPDKLYLELKYYLRMGKKLQLSNPQTFTQKLNWLKLYDRNPYYTKLVDKYEVKNIVAEKIGEEYVVPLYGVYDRFDDIDFNKLPDSFVLKTTHDSGGLVVVKDKSSFDVAAAKKKIEKSLKTNYWKYGREWPYKNVPHRIIAEEYIPSLGKEDSIEYKLTCMNGECRMVSICQGIPHVSWDTRWNDHFDRDWNRMDFVMEYRNTNKDYKKTPIIEKMMKLSEILAADLPTARVDFYVVDDKIYFGEITCKRPNLGPGRIWLR